LPDDRQQEFLPPFPTAQPYWLRLRKLRYDFLEGSLRSTRAARLRVQSVTIASRLLPAWVKRQKVLASASSAARDLRQADHTGNLEKTVALALRFTLTVPGIHTAIVGTSRPGRIRQNMAALESGPLPPELYSAIRNRWQEIAPRDWVGETWRCRFLRFRPRDDSWQ